MPAPVEPSPADKASPPAQSASPAAATETDKPAADRAVIAGSEDDNQDSLEKARGEEIQPAKPATKEKNGKHPRPAKSSSWERHGDRPPVRIMENNTLAAGEEAEAVVSILGSSTSAGTVREAVVSVLGSSTSSGDVGQAVVSVLGNTRVTGGTVGDAAVAVLGNNYVNAHIRGNVVAVLGNIELGPDAVVGGELVSVGGKIIRDPTAVVHGHVQSMPLGGSAISAWVTQCLFYGRPLAFGPELMWAWWIALSYLGFYAFVALVASGPVFKCVQTLEERPGKSILAGLLVMLLTPVIYVLLALTVFIVIGVALIPLFTLGLFFAGLFGKVVMLAWLGRRITKLFRAEAKAPAVVAVLIGGLVVLGLYTVPVLGFIVYKLLGILGVGVVVYTLLLSIKSNRPTPPRPAPMTSAAIPPPLVGDVAAAVNVAPLPLVISAASLPRAGFWLRFAATLLDVIMVGILFSMLGGVLGAFFRVNRAFPLCFAIYNVVMWTTKGTTIGGIICGLKVVRVDDRPIEWSVAIVRALSAFLSFVVAGLGFIWVSFDDERQSWHDKIAGTTIVRVPRGTSLL